MCEFCNATEIEKKNFYEWANANPYEGDDQVWEGMWYLLDDNNFIISTASDGGYLRDELNLRFNFCPMCGRKL